jgi:protein-S-isoprenylcysteine O-methyltransferase Ste14
VALAYQSLFPALWLCWLGYWWLMSADVKDPARQEPLGSRLLHVVPLAIAALLLWVPSVPVPWLNVRFMTEGAWQFWLGAALTAAGLLFTVWARRHLGRNWSAVVTIKHDHELVVSGPYCYARHPIYTGLLLAFVGSALARGEWRGVLAVLIAFLSLWRKLRLEERWMAEQFGERYRAYSAEVSALIPFVL